MLFPTVSFTLFFLALLAGWKVIPDRAEARTWFIALASLVFYGVASPPLLVYLLAWCALLTWAGRSDNLKLLPWAVAAGIGQLVFWRSFELLPRGNLPESVAHWATPLGVSFFTFQGLTYLFSRARGELAPWRFVDVVGFTSFFPTVFSGPILRAADWQRQMEQTPWRDCDDERFNRAMTWMSLGLFYKLCLSSLLADPVDAAWSEPGEQSASVLWLAAYAYGFQLYTDFAGYSFLAAAVALLMGFEVPRNFNQPYLATSLQEFWRRWHMSLSSWLRDYVYIGLLKGNALGKPRQVLNVMLTFFLCGAWHGFALHYLIWGLWQAVGVGYSSVARMVRPQASEPSAVLRVVYGLVTLQLVMLGWVWFRAPDTTTALAFFGGLFTNAWDWQPEHALTAALVLLAALVHLVEHRVVQGLQTVGRWPALAQVLGWAGVGVLVLMVSPAGLPPFIYFKY